MMRTTRHSDKSKLRGEYILGYKTEEENCGTEGDASRDTNGMGRVGHDYRL